jgi:hypothetical protein
MIVAKFWTRSPTMTTSERILEHKHANRRFVLHLSEGREFDVKAPISLCTGRVMTKSISSQCLLLPAFRSRNKALVDRQ